MAGVVNQALAKIDGADLGVAPNFFGRSFSNQSAAIKHQDSIGVLEHDVHIVLSKENADRFFPRDARGQPLKTGYQRVSRGTRRRMVRARRTARPV